MIQEIIERVGRRRLRDEQLEAAAQRWRRGGGGVSARRSMPVLSTALSGDADDRRYEITYCRRAAYYYCLLKKGQLKPEEIVTLRV